MSDRRRNAFVFIFLTVVLAFAGLLAMNRAVRWLAPVYWLSQFQAFHVVAHFSIFAGVVILYGPHDRSTARMWALVVGGAVLLELVQAVMGGFSLTRAWLLDSVFDVAVDVAGAALCWHVKTRHHRQITSSVANHTAYW